MIRNSEELKTAIQELERKQAYELVLLKEQYNITKENLKPGNLIKTMFRETVSDHSLQSDALNAAIGYTTGLVARKLMIGKTINPLKKLLGVALEMAVAGRVAKNAGVLKTAGAGIFNMLFRKKYDTNKEGV